VKPLIAAAVLLTCLPAWGKGDTSHFIDQLACDSGPYGLKLPKSYDELRKIAPLKNERMLRQENLGRYQAQYRDLTFNGLRLGVVTYSNDADKYQVVSAEIRGPQWRIAGPFRQGQVLPARVGDVDNQGVEEHRDHRIQRHRGHGARAPRRRRVSVLTYLCVPD